MDEGPSSKSHPPSTENHHLNHYLNRTRRAGMPITTELSRLFFL